MLSLITCHVLFAAFIFSASSCNIPCSALSMFGVVIVPAPRCILAHSIPCDVVLHSVHTYNMFVALSINLTLSYILEHSIFLAVNYFISNVLLARSALNFISFVIELHLG